MNEPMQLRVHVGNASIPPMMGWVSGLTASPTVAKAHEPEPAIKKKLAHLKNGHYRCKRYKCNVTLPKEQMVQVLAHDPQYLFCPKCAEETAEKRARRAAKAKNK